MRPLNTLAACGFIALCLMGSGCSHPWPKAATGGLAERDGPVEAEHSDIAAAILIERGRTNTAPARIAVAEEQLVLAIREHAAGLCEDSEENTLAASIALGGHQSSNNTRSRNSEERRCSGYFAGKNQ